MSFIHTIKQSVASATGTVETSNSYSGSSIVEVVESIAIAAADFAINIAIDVSAVKSIFILSDQDLTLETNDGTTPDDTITLKANVPYIWNADSYDVFLLTTDVTQLLLTNASGVIASLRVIVSQDSTP